MISLAVKTNPKWLDNKIYERIAPLRNQAVCPWFNNKLILRILMHGNA